MELEQSMKEKVLILGGTNFMGKSLLDLLSISKPQAQVYCINRGKTYWNNEARRHHNYQHFVADRKQHKDTLTMVRYLNEKLSISEANKWKVVVDFSAFRWRDVQSILKGINNVAQRYIYISSDSVYNNQKGHFNLPIKQNQFDTEAQCAQERKQQSKSDKYGYNKLKCQVYIKKRSRIPSYCLRLPDVIGPYDNTDRFWTTLQWVKRSQQHPIPLSGEDEQKQLSFVYSIDVCRFILQLIDIKNPQSDFINLGFRQNPTLQQLIRLIAKKIKMQPRFRAVKDESNNCYPSTQFGHISVQRLVKQYEFEPSTLEQAIQHTVMFFNEKGAKFDKERTEMQRLLNKKIKNLAQ